ncbi:MAG TPA: hypothetical protein VGK78_01630 [Nocardioides sp.]|uniref:hypothetical protein n=1 Tax=Nocardioides sp. TaxID=35761 RepID=UPI002F3FA408
MEILWWLAPPAVATVLAMLWVSWLGREGRGEVDREVAVRRLDAAMSRPTRVVPRAVPPRTSRSGERSTGVAVRPSSRAAARRSARDAATRHAS